MARGKKAAKELSPEEKLQQALVPVEEQPYPIPENWCWVRLGSLLNEIKNGTTIKQDKSSSGYWVTRIESLQNQTIDFNRLGSIVNKCDIKDTDWYMAGDIALSHINSADHVGKTALINADMLPLVHGMNLLRLRFNENCIPAFFQYYSQSFQYKEEILSRINMAVNQVSINQKQLGSLEFPLPTLPEQHRIISRIESLFAKLDEAKEKAQAVVDSFELRKSVILHKAFAGELTEWWRKDHGVGLDSWKIMSLNDCIQKMQNGLAKRSGSIGESYVVLRLANLSENGFDTSDLREILLDEKEQEAYSLLENDVIMIRVNGSKDNVGRQLLVPDVKKWAFCDHIIRIRYRNNVLPDYMVLFSKSDNYRTYVKNHMVSSAGQNTISRKGIANMAVPVPECDEQKEIVRTLSVLFNKEQQAKEAAETVLAQIDTIKKAILARAFRGELGTNDPAEEWAGELVKAVL
ncbi:hypothetical protein D3Z58_12025 [Clostridiaceae bacterium]|nr:hypothetical protein [Clostridiaceae bacterium]